MRMRQLQEKWGRAMRHLVMPKHAFLPAESMHLRMRDFLRWRHMPRCPDYVHQLQLHQTAKLWMPVLRVLRLLQRRRGLFNCFIRLYESRYLSL